MDEKLKKLHDEACKKGQDFYIDPATGFQVFTEFYHKAKGYCCESGCRHCPYGFKKKKFGKRGS